MTHTFSKHYSSSSVRVQLHYTKLKRKTEGRPLRFFDALCKSKWLTFTRPVVSALPFLRSIGLSVATLIQSDIVGGAYPLTFALCPIDLFRVDPFRTRSVLTPVALGVPPVQGVVIFGYTLQGTLTLDNLFSIYHRSMVYGVNKGQHWAALGNTRHLFVIP